MLADLYHGSIQDAERRKTEVSTRQLEANIEMAPAPLTALDIFPRRAQVHILAEIKRASPSKGRLADIPDPVELAQTYEHAGASAISVLTEERKFLGSVGDLAAVSSAVKVPTLRKDFIATEYQLLEARAYGASLFLLIVAGLEESDLRRLLKFGESLGMQALVETHTLHEVKTAADLGAKIIGVNARNLSTFETDLGLFGTVVDAIPDHVVKIAESAVKVPSDVKRYHEEGADVVLVGEALVTSDADSTLKEFLRAGAND